MTKNWAVAPAGVKGDWAWGHRPDGSVGFRAAQNGQTLFVIHGPTLKPGGERVSVWVRRVVQHLVELGLDRTGFEAEALIESARDAYAHQFEWSDADLTGGN